MTHNCSHYGFQLAFRKFFIHLVSEYSITKIIIHFKNRSTAFKIQARHRILLLPDIDERNSGRNFFKDLNVEIMDAFFKYHHGNLLQSGNYHTS